MLTSRSEVLTPAELSIASELQRPPARQYSIRADWVMARLPPSPTTRARSSPPVTPDRVVGPVADLLGSLVPRPDEGADAAEEQEVGARRQDRAQDLVRRRLVAGEVEQAPASAG